MTDAESDWVVLSRGVPQGLLLGPLFLFFYVHDLKSTLFCQIIHDAVEKTLLSCGKKLELCI